MGNEAQRAKLYQTVAQHWGEEAAETVMTALPPWDYTEVARKADVANAKVELEARISALDTKIDGVEARLEAKIDAQFYRLVAFFLPLMFGVAGLVLAAAALA